MTALKAIGTVRTLGNGRIVVQRGSKGDVHLTVQRGVAEADGTARLSPSAMKKLKRLLVLIDTRKGAS